MELVVIILSDINPKNCIKDIKWLLLILDTIFLVVKLFKLVVDKLSLKLNLG